MKTNFSCFAASSARKNEGGFVLATALIFLVALTILGVSALGVNTLEEKMLGYSRDRQLALQAADAALRDAERYLLSGNITGATNFVPDCSSGGLYQIRTSGKPIWAALENEVACKDAAWAGETSAVNAADGKSFKYGATRGSPHVVNGVGDFKPGDTSSSGGLVRAVASQPRFIIEVIPISSTSGKGSGSLVVGRGPGSPMYVYRVTAVGFGQRLTSRVMLQAVYRP